MKSHLWIIWLLLDGGSIRLCGTDRVLDEVTVLWFPRLFSLYINSIQVFLQCKIHFRTWLRCFSVMFVGNFSTISSDNAFPQHLSQMLVEWAKAYWTADFHSGSHSHRMGSWTASVWKQEGFYKVCTDFGQLEYTTFQRASWFILLSPTSGFTGLDFLSKTEWRELTERESNIQTKTPKLAWTDLWMDYFISVLWSIFEKRYKEDTEDTWYSITFLYEKFTL